MKSVVSKCPDLHCIDLGRDSNKTLPHHSIVPVISMDIASSTENGLWNGSMPSTVILPSIRVTRALEMILHETKQSDYITRIASHNCLDLGTLLSVFVRLGHSMIAMGLTVNCSLFQVSTSASHSFLVCTGIML